MKVGYGKAMGMVMALAELPILGGFFLGLAFPRYFLYCFVGGLAGMFVALLLAQFYSLMRSRGLQRIGLTVQYADGSDEYFDVIYRDMPVDVSEKAGGGRHAYVIKDVEGREWIVQMDHPLEEVLPRFDSIPLFAGMPTPVLTRFVTAASLSENRIKLDAEPSWIDRILRRKPKDEAESLEVYAYATPVTVKRQKAAVPSFDGTRSLFKDVVSYDYARLQSELEQLRDHNEDLNAMLKNHLPIALRVKPLKIEGESTFKAGRAVAAIVVFVVFAAAALAALYLLGVIW